VTRWWAAFPGKRPASGSFLYNSTYWWVNRQAGAPSPYRSGFCAKTGASIAGYMIRGGHAPLSYLHSPGTLTQWWAVFWKSDLPRAIHPEIRPTGGSVRRSGLETPPRDRFGFGLGFLKTGACVHAPFSPT